MLEEITPSLRMGLLILILGIFVGVFFGIIVKSASLVNGIIFGAIIGAIAGLIAGMVSETPILLLFVGTIVGGVLGLVVIAFVVPDEQLKMASGEILSRILFWIICGGGVGWSSGILMLMLAFGIRHRY